ncbi:hypothetical protein SprV_0802502000 [Sparganum proliferum]
MAASEATAKDALAPSSPNKPFYLPAGRYEFKDSGIYIGEWLDEKAVGLGLITKDKSQGEYTGLWEAGSEKSGVFLWPNAPGAMYEGEWASNRRNGFGVFNREDWAIMGKFVDDFITIGVKGKENTAARFEGRFENGLPAFGVETYGDGGIYAGEYKNGIREGLGVRKSIPYGEVLSYYPEAQSAANSSKLDELKKRGKLPSKSPELRHRVSCVSDRSGDVPCDTDVDDDPNEIDPDESDPAAVVKVDAEPYTAPSSRYNGGFRRDREHEIRLLATRFKCGFVLTSRRSDLFIRRIRKLQSPRRNPFGCRPARASSSRRARTQSLSDLFQPDEGLPSQCSGFTGSCMKQLRSSTISVHSSPRSPHKKQIASGDMLELDLVSDDTVEVYSGEWLSDTRHGFGVCERTDGLSYCGQWFKNQRHGLGQTRFQDGTFEQGRYHNGKLVFLALPIGSKPHLALYNYHMMREIHLVLERARTASEAAHKKAIEAREQVSSTILDYVEKAKAAAATASEYSLEARELVREMYPDFEQPGVKYLEDIVRMMRVSRRGSPTFEAALQSAKDVIAGVIRGLTRTGDEESEEEELQPQEDLTLPPKFSFQINANQKNDKKPISRAGSLREQRRARLAKMQEQQKRLQRMQQQKLLKEQQQQMQGENSPTPEEYRSQPDGQAEANSDWIRAAQETPKTATPQAGSSPDGNIYLRVPEPAFMSGDSSRFDEDEDDENSEGSSYVDLPNMAEVRNQYEIPAFPLIKLLANPTLLTNHFDYYASTESSEPVNSKVNQRQSQHPQPPETPIVPDEPGMQRGGMDLTAAPLLEAVTELQPPSEGFVFSFRVPQWSWTKKEDQQEQQEKYLTVDPPESARQNSRFSISSLAHFLPGRRSNSEDHSMPSNVLIRENTADSSTLHQASDLFDWFRANTFLLIIIGINIFLLRVFFNQIEHTDEDS